MKKKNNPFWKGVPDQLRYMCLADLSGTYDCYCTEAILKYLLDHMNDHDSFIHNVTPYDVIRWIDKAFETSLFPLEQHEDAWLDHIDEITQILNRSEELIQIYAPSDYRDGYITTDDDEARIDIIGWAQKLDIYFSVLYMYTENWEKLRERLGRLLEDTKANIFNTLIFFHDNVYATANDDTEHHYWGMDRIEPIYWLSKESLPQGKATEIYAETLEKYALYLYELKSSMPSVCSKLHKRAEERLRVMCDSILDTIYDSQESEDDGFIAADDSKKYDEMYFMSEERCSE